MATGSGRRGRPRKNATDPPMQDATDHSPMTDPPMQDAADPPRQDDDPWFEMMKLILDQTKVTNNLLKLLTQVAAPNQPTPPHHEDPNRAFFQFYKVNPPSFFGGTGVMEALHWLDSMEKIFNLIKCTEEQKVTFATFMLKEAADNWWWGERARFSSSGTPLDWENFQRAFLDRYFPKFIREQKFQEFVLLRQEDLSVREYLTKFEELNWCASHAKYQIQMDEKWKINQFQQGLRIDIRNALAHVTFTSFYTLVDRSYEIEAGLRKREVEGQQKWYNNKKQRVDIRGNVNR